MSGGSCFNVSFVVMGKATKTVSTIQNFRREKRADAESTRGLSAYQLRALPARPNRLLRKYTYILTNGNGRIDSNRVNGSGGRGQLPILKAVK